MIDNFAHFPWEFAAGEFYYIQVIQRDKDNPWVTGLNGGNSCRIIKSYSVYNEDQLIKYETKAKAVAELHNARVYMHPARRADKDIASLMIIMLGEYLRHSKHSLSRIYESACWTDKGVERRWIIDIDTKDQDELVKVRKAVDASKPCHWNHYLLETIHGRHLITKPFDTRWFDFPRTIQKNNPTLLYYKENI